jgi:hypothetical protein
MSSSSARVRVTDWPAIACVRSPSKVAIRVTRAPRPVRWTVTASPGRTVPLLDQRRARVPRHRAAALGDIVAGQARDRDRGERGDSGFVGESSVVGDDLVEARLRIADEVHLVNREDDVADAEQVDEEAVAAGLGEYPFSRVDEQHGKLGGRGAGDHVAGELLMPRGVGDDELALRGREETIGDVDRDALLALGGKAVDEQRHVERSALCARLATVDLERRQLVLEQRVGVVEQPADEGRLAVVNRPAGEEAKQRLPRVRGEIGVKLRARFRRTVDPEGGSRGHRQK